jgi:hypothetical protein
VGWGEKEREREIPDSESKFFIPFVKLCLPSGQVMGKKKAD